MLASSRRPLHGACTTRPAVGLVRPGLPPPPPHSFRVQCCQQGPLQPQEQQPLQQQTNDRNLATLAFRIAMLATAANAAVACVPPEAQASWRPRRHLSQRLQEKYKAEHSAVQAVRKAEAKKVATATRQTVQKAEVPAPKNLLQTVQTGVQRMWREQPVYSVGMSNRLHALSGSSGRPSPSPFGWVPLVLAAGVALLLAFGRKLRLPWAGGRRSAGGRWVRDRSLGGKMVWLPDADAAPAGTKQPRPLWEDLDGEEEAAAAAAAAASAAGTGPWATASSAGATSAEAPAEPDWWQAPRFVVYATADRKEELQRQARAVLRQLEDAKLLQGLDYPVSGLVALRTLCQEAGGYQVKARTEQGRDAMLRAAVRASIAAAQEGAYSLIGGDQPARFVCGLAHDLGVPDKRAVTIVHAEVAAVCRSALIDAEAAYRASNRGDILLALIKLAGALQTFPLPRGSAEAELVAAGVSKQTSLEFRKAIFFEFGAVSPELAALVAELLGFNPELVMPVLRQQLEAAQAAEAAAQQQQGGSSQG